MHRTARERKRRQARLSPLLQVAVQEVRRLQKYGVTQSEMERYTMALLRDSEQAAESASCIPSLEMLDYSMESIGLDHVIMDQRQVPSRPRLSALTPSGGDEVLLSHKPSCLCPGQEGAVLSCGDPYSLLGRFQGFQGIVVYGCRRT